MHNFWREIFLLLYFINWPNFIVWLPLLGEILNNISIAIICKPSCDIMNFSKRAFKMNQKHFSSFLKLLSAIFYQIFIFSLNDSPSKTKKNVFYSIQRALFLLKILKFLLIFFLPFHTFQIQKGIWKWNNLWCHKLACINFQM